VAAAIAAPRALAHCSCSSASKPLTNSNISASCRGWCVLLLKLQLQALLPPGWAGQVLLLLLQSPDVMPGNAHQVITQGSNHSSSSSSCNCSELTSLSMQAGSLPQNEAGLQSPARCWVFSVQEWQLWLQLQSKLCDRMGLLC